MFEPLGLARERCRPATRARLRAGAPIRKMRNWILSDLKTLLETGAAMGA